MHHNGYIANVNDLPQFKNMMEQSERVEYEKSEKEKKQQQQPQRPQNKVKYNMKHSTRKNKFIYHLNQRAPNNSPST